MAKYKVKNTNILHNGKFVSIGSIIELTEDEAKVLEDVVTPIKETKTTESKTTNNKTNKTATKTKAEGETQDNTITPADETQADGGNK